MGEMFRISSATVEDFTERLQDTEGFIQGDFMEQYRLHIIMKQNIARAAKVFLINNWTKVTDWTMLDVVIHDKNKKNKKKTRYYNHVPQPSGAPEEETGASNEDKSIFAQVMEDVHAWQAKKHNPVVSITEMILDPTDEDFSVTINGKEHWWIDDDSVIILADYAEQQLKAQQS